MSTEQPKDSWFDDIKTAITMINKVVNKLNEISDALDLIGLDRINHTIMNLARTLVDTDDLLTQAMGKYLGKITKL